MMRVVVNQLAALGQKTGIGHYTSQLLRCLRAASKPGEIEAYPEGWLKRGRQAFTQIRPYLEGGRTSSHLPGAGGAPRVGWRSQAVGVVRQVGRTLTGQHFRVASWR